MAQRKIAQDEIRFLQEALTSDYVNGNIRLREGEYQFSLAKAIASFQLELSFPDVKDIIRQLYGEEKTNDIQFIRKIQTILKKMEKGNIVKILPKKKPWELQRYSLSSFKFRDSDKELVALATDQEIQQTQDILNSSLDLKQPPKMMLQNAKIKIPVLALIIIISYAAIVWDLIQPIINPIIFVPMFSIAVACSIMLGKALSVKE